MTLTALVRGNEILERAQKGELDATPWMHWFLGCLDRAFNGAEATLATVLCKARFRESRNGEPFNDRQRKIVTACSMVSTANSHRPNGRNLPGSRKTTQTAMSMTGLNAECWPRIQPEAAAIATRW
jgi:hypothetical protein